MFCFIKKANTFKKIIAIISVVLLFTCMLSFPANAALNESNIIDKTSWVATAYQNGNNLPAQNCIDNDLDTRWQNGEAQIANNLQWIKIDFNSILTFDTIMVYSKEVDGYCDYMRGYKIEISNDDFNWISIAEGFGEGENTNISLNIEKARYIKITQTGTADSNWWSINEIDVSLNQNEPISKKGIGASRYNWQLSYLENLGVDWYYNWGFEPAVSDVTNMEYVPMLWSAPYVNDYILNKVTVGYQNGSYKNLLAFNEPDLWDQSNMSVDEAIALWPQLESIGIRLGSPAVASYYSGWLQEFMEKAILNDLRVDFIAIHIYQDYSNPDAAVQELENILSEIYEMYHLPIWLTEFGTVDVSTWAGETRPECYDVEVAKEYETKSIALLERLGYVERYAWFVDNFMQTGTDRPVEAPFTSMYNDDNTISETGAVYKAIQSNSFLDIDVAAKSKLTLGVEYNARVTVLGGAAPYHYSAYFMPEGLNINSQTGLITGTANDINNYNAVIQVTDSKGQQRDIHYCLVDESNLWLIANGKNNWNTNHSWYNWYGSWGEWLSQPAPQIVDNNPATYFQIDAQYNARSFIVDFNEALSVDALSFNAGFDGEYPTAFKVLYDNNGSWKQISSKEIICSNESWLICNSSVTTSKIMIQLTETNIEKKWSISEVEIYTNQYFE